MSIYLTDEHGKLHKVAGAGYVEIDKELNKESINPVQNKTLYNPVAFAESERQKSKNLWPYGNIGGNIYVPVVFDKPLAAGTYTLSYICNSSDTDSDVCMVVVYNVSGIVKYINLPRDSRVSESFTSYEDITQIWFYASNGYSPSIGDRLIFTNIQLEEGSVATNYQPYHGPITHNEDAPVVFAESERQKSKNLLVYPYTGEVYQYGVTFTDNGDGSFTINGKQTDTTANSYHYMETDDTFKLSAGTYTLKAFADTSVTGWNVVLYDGTYYHEVSSPNITRTITFNEDKKCRVYIQVPKTSTTTFNNFVVKPILVKGTEVGEWQPYNGAIVHEKDVRGVEQLETIYDKTSSDSTINKGYSNGIQFGVDVSFPGMQSKYKGWYFTFYIHGGTLRVYTPNTDIGHISTINRIAFACTEQGAGAAIAYGGLNIVYDSIASSGCRYFHCETYTNNVVKNNEKYYISKIEGVLL